MKKWRLVFAPVKTNTCNTDVQTIRIELTGTADAIRHRAKEFTEDMMRITAMEWNCTTMEEISDESEDADRRHV